MDVKKLLKQIEGIMETLKVWNEALSSVLDVREEQLQLTGTYASNSISRISHVTGAIERSFGVRTVSIGVTVVGVVANVSRS